MKWRGQTVSIETRRLTRAASDPLPAAEFRLEFRLTSCPGHRGDVAAGG